MPTYSIQAPDGKTYSIDGPAGATRDQVIAAIQSRMGGTAPSAPDASSQIPGNENAQDGNRNVGQPDKSSLWDRITGAGEAGLSTVSHMLGGTVGQIGGTLGALAGAIATGEYGTPTGAQRVEDVAGNSAQNAAQAVGYQPRTDKGREYTQALGQAVQDSGIAGLPIGPEMAVMGSLAAPSLQQARMLAGDAASGAGQVARATATQAADAIADSPEAYMAGNAYQAARDAVIPDVDPAKAALAQKALDMGITIPPHALSDNKFIRMAGELADNTPLSGSSSAANRDAFNRYLIDQIGGDTDATRLTPEVFAAAQKQSGQTIGNIFSQIAVPADDPQLVSDLSDLLRAQGRELDPTKNLIEGNVTELARIAEDNGGMIPGSTLKNLHSEIGAKLRGNLDANPGMRQQLSDFQDILESAADRQITDPAMKQAYDTARVQYAKSKTLEPLVARGGLDGVSPQALLGQLNSTKQGKYLVATGRAGDLGDAAQIAQQFMKQQPSSGTAERLAMMNIMTSLKGAGKVALFWPIAKAYNKFGQRVAQAMIDQALGQTKKPILAPQELELMDESPFTPSPVEQAPEPQYNGLLTLADDNDPAYAIGGVPKNVDPNSVPSGLVPDTQRLSTRHDVDTVDFPLRQEVLQQPDISAAIDAFNAENARLSKIATNAISPPIRAKAQRDLEALRTEFGNGMRQLGISNAADAHGLNRPLYEAGVQTRLPIQRTFTPQPPVAPPMPAPFVRQRMPGPGPLYPTPKTNVGAILGAKNLNEAIEAADASVPSINLDALRADSHANIIDLARGLKKR